MTMASLPDVVRSPDRYFSRRLTYLDAVVPIVIAIGVGVFLSYAYRPFFAAALFGSLPVDATPEAVDSLVARVLRFSALGATIVPLAHAATIAALAFVFLAAFGGALPKFESLCVCAAWAALLLTGKDLARYGMLVAGGLDSVRRVADLQPGVGLGFLSSVHGSPMYNLLETLNGFDIGFLWVLAFAISRSESIGFRSAVAATLACGSLMHAVRIGFGVLFSR
jgi:hypothetical protein